MHAAVTERLTEYEAAMLNEVRRAYHARLVEIEHHPRGYTEHAAERRQLKMMLAALTKMLRPYGYDALPEPFVVSMQAVLGTGEGRVA